MNGQRLRGLLLALIGSLVLAAPTTALALVGPEEGPEAEVPESEPPTADDPVRYAAAVKKLRAQIRKHRARTWHWQRVMGRPLAGTSHNERRTTSLVKLNGILTLWQKRSRLAHRRAKRPPNRPAWLCINRHEGSWRDPNPPYWGGLQMDMQFQRTYGRYLLRKKGTANRWKPIEQMWTAEKARRSGRGFHPWPNTARRCGLL